MTTQTAALVCIGDELLDGRVSDANVSPIAQALTQRHLALVQTTFIRDTPETIVRTLDAMIDEGHALILVTGGLGPTEDDRTRYAVATLIDEPLERNEDALATIRERFATRGRTLTPNNLVQADFPRGATILPSAIGTAAGFSVTHRGARLVFFPGVPREVAWFLEHHIDAIAGGLNDHGASSPWVHAVTLFGLGESAFEQALLPLPDGLDTRCTLGWCARDPIISLTVSSSDPEAFAAITGHVHARLGQWIIATGKQSGFEVLGERCIAQAFEVTTAESCTGGLIAAAITDVSGSSSWFKRGFVTYANESKHDLLGVLESTLAAHGAVSAQTVMQMSHGARQRAGATHAISVSGIAGPGGGTPEKPVGTVHFALTCPHGTYHHQAIMSGRTREQVRQRSVYIALSMLLWSVHHDATRRDACIVPLSGPYEEAHIWAAEGAAPLDTSTQAMTP